MANGSDKFPYFAAEAGIYRTTVPNPHVDLSGEALQLGSLFASRTFAATAADTGVDFDDGDSCQVYIVEEANNANAAIYAGAIWNAGTPDIIDLSTATLKAAIGTLVTGVGVIVLVQQPEGRALPDAEGLTVGTMVQADGSGDWVTV